MEKKKKSTVVLTQMKWFNLKPTLNGFYNDFRLDLSPCAFVLLVKSDVESAAIFFFFSQLPSQGLITAALSSTLTIHGGESCGVVMETLDGA